MSLPPYPTPPAPDSDTDWFVVGVVIKPFSRHGEVAVEATSGEPERFLDVQRLTARLTRSGRQVLRPLQVESVRIHQGRALVKFDGIDSINDAEELRNAELLLSRDELIELDEDEYFYFELIGCEVYDQAGRHLGSVSDMEEAGPNLLLVLDTPHGEVSVPFVNEFFPEVDVEARRILMRPIPGLLGGDVDDEPPPPEEDLDDAD